MFIKKGTKTGICFWAIIEHYNYNYYYYTFTASVVLVFVVEIIFFLPNSKITLEQNSLKNIAGHFFFSSFPCFSNLRGKSIHKFQSEKVHTKITCRRMT